MAKRSVAAAVQRGLDCIFDTSTGGGDALFQKLKETGYKVRLRFVDLPTEEAIRCANVRALTSNRPEIRGRFVPEDVIREKHQVAAEAFSSYRNSPFVDAIHGYDTTSRTPVRFYEKIGSHETIHDQARLDAVDRKAAGRESKPAQAHRE